MKLLGFEYYDWDWIGTKDTGNNKEWISGRDMGSGKESGVWQMVCTAWS